MWCRKILELLPYKEIGDTRINKERTKDYNIYYDYTYTHTYTHKCSCLVLGHDSNSVDTLPYLCEWEHAKVGSFPSVVATAAPLNGIHVRIGE